MKLIAESPNKERWPRKKVKSVEARKRDLIIRITDWTDDEDEPAFDVEVYVGGVYDWNLSHVFATKSCGRTKDRARKLAVEFASNRINSLL